jgi:hypothetical protein
MTGYTPQFTYTLRRREHAVNVSGSRAIGTTVTAVLKTASAAAQALPYREIHQNRRCCVFKHVRRPDAHKCRSVARRVTGFEGRTESGRSTVELSVERRQRASGVLAPRVGPQLVIVEDHDALAP